MDEVASVSFGAVAAFFAALSRRRSGATGVSLRGWILQLVRAGNAFSDVSNRNGDDRFSEQLVAVVTVQTQDDGDQPVIHVLSGHATIVTNTPPPTAFDPCGPDAPIAWYGGKYYLARWIIEYLPAHRVYVEPFGGMANVLLKKVPSEVEIFNDLDGRLVNFFRVIREPDQLAELQRRCELTPYSREEFAQLCETPEPTDPIEKAHWFFVRCRQARGGIGMSSITRNAWAASTRSRRQMPEPVSKYLSAVDGLSGVAARFRRVMIEGMPAVELIHKYDAPDVLFYCDPPYLGSTRHGGRATTYHVEMTDDDHRRLLDAVRGVQGKMVLSGYPSPMYDDALRSWTRVERPMKVQFSNSGGDRTEVLWIKA